MTPKPIAGIKTTSVRNFTNQCRRGQPKNIQMQIALPINPRTARPKPKYPLPWCSGGQNNSAKQRIPKSEIIETAGYNQTETESFGDASRNSVPAHFQQLSNWSSTFSLHFGHRHINALSMLPKNTGLRSSSPCSQKLCSLIPKYPAASRCVKVGSSHPATGGLSTGRCLFLKLGNAWHARH